MISICADIKILVWDFDGTLYQLNDAIWKDIYEAQFRVIMDHTGWSHEKAVSEHTKLYKVIYQSGTFTAAKLAGISVAQAVLETEKYFDREKYIRRDEKLITMFDKLKQYRHIMFVNGKKSCEEEALDILGIPRTTFEKWITPEEISAVKPDPACTKAILSYTKLPAVAHLVIGDRESVDLASAHNLGMKTCLVWSDTPGTIADVTLPTVYDVPSLIL